MIGLKKCKGLKKALTLTMLGIMTIGTVLGSTSINASAHNAYYLSVTIDEGNFRYVPTVVYEENDWVANSHREKDAGDFTSKTVADKTSAVNSFTVPTIDYTKDEAEIKKKYDEIIQPGDGDKGLAFTFPGLHSRGFAVGKRHANANDEEMVYFMSEFLVGSLNDSLSWMANKAGGYKKFTSQTMRNFSADLANKAESVLRGGGTQSVTLGSQTFSISKGTNQDIAKPVEGKTTINDYVVLKSSDGEEKYALARVNKGYQKRDDIPAEYKQGLKDYKDPEYLNWQYIVLQGNNLADVKNITFSSVNEIVKPGAFELAIGNMFSSLLGGLRNLLGLYPMEDVMLNGGSRNVGYYYGVMPKSWMNTASLLNFICQIIAWLVMGFAFVRMLFKRQLATMNIGERMSLMEGIKDIFLTGFLLAGFAIIFHTMIRVNYSLVEVFKSSSYFSSYIGTTQSMSTGVLASIVINFAFFFINAYFNFVYVLRAFTVTMLYGLAPLAIVTISFGGKYKSVFSNFMKELVANIFLQTFHAMCVALFTSVTATSQMRTFELITILIAFIPLTNLIRQGILGLPGGITDQASGLLSMGRSVATGTVGGLIGGNIAKRGGGGSGAGQGGIGINPNISRNLSSGNTSKVGQMRDSLAGTPQVSNASLRSGMTDGNGGTVNTAGVSKHVAGTNTGAMRNIAKGFGQIGGSIASAGATIGFGAVGDKRGMEQFSSIGGSAIQGAKNSFASAVSSPELTGAGAKDLYQNHENSTMVMNDTRGRFNSPEFEGSDYETNFNEMRDCFLGTGLYSDNGAKSQFRTDALKYYKSQGIQGLKENERGNTVIGFSNKMYDKKNFTLKDVANITPFNQNMIKNN